MVLTTQQDERNTLGTCDSLFTALHLVLHINLSTGHSCTIYRCSARNAVPCRGIGMRSPPSMSVTLCTSSCKDSQFDNPSRSGTAQKFQLDILLVKMYHTVCKNNPIQEVSCGERHPDAPSKYRFPYLDHGHGGPDIIRIFWDQS